MSEEIKTVHPETEKELEALENQGQPLPETVEEALEGSDTKPEEVEEVI